MPRFPTGLAGVLALAHLLVGCRQQEPGMHIVLLDLDPSTEGEASLVIGPNGTSVLIDAGSSVHAGEIHAAVEEWSGGDRVDDLIVTSYSTDHVGGLSQLLDPASDHALATGRVITRGPVDLSGAADLESYNDICGLDSAARLDLCAAEEEVGCDSGAAPVTASGCDGLSLGDLDDPSDDGEGSFIDLGSGAVLRFWYVDGFTLGGRLVDTGDDEGARSIVVSVEWDGFRYLRGGDIGGGLEGRKDVESALVAADVLPLAESKIVQLNDHGRSDASNEDWLDALSGTVTTVVGGGSAYAGSPSAHVVWGVLSRLGPYSVVAVDAGPGGTSEDVTLCREGIDIQVWPGDYYHVGPDSCEAHPYEDRVD